jgi:hypothetical protein
MKFSESISKVALRFFVALRAGDWIGEFWS